jgi:hypothetical protein
VGRADEFVDRVRKRHVDELRRHLEASHVVGEAEHGRPALRLVGADPFEHPRPVVEPVAPDVDLGVVPVDELTVEPDLLGLVHGERLPPTRGTH